MTPGPPGCFLCPSLILALQDGSETTGLCQHFASGDRGFSSLAQFWVTEKKRASLYLILIRALAGWANCCWLNFWEQVVNLFGQCAEACHSTQLRLKKTGPGFCLSSTQKAWHASPRSSAQWWEICRSFCPHLKKHFTCFLNDLRDS